MVTQFGRIRRSSAKDPGNGAVAPGQVFAALDLGTNNCRLLIARPAPQGTHEGFRVIDAFSRIVRLGEGLAASGDLSERAMARTIEALKVCAGKIQRNRVTRSRYVATEACRRAANCAAFLARAEREAGIALEIISSSEEARLGLQSCLPLLQDSSSYGLVFDIGGGSTELSWLKLGGGGGGRRNGGATELRGWHSLPLGVVTLAERFGGGEVSPAAYAAMIEEVEALLRPLEARAGLAKMARRRELQMLGTSGTVTTLAGLQKRLPRYERARIDGCYLDFQAALRTCRRITTMSYRQRASYPCIGRERADLVVAGCAIFEAIGRTWPVGKIRVADRGLREGMIFALMGRSAQLSSPDAPSAALPG